MKYSLATVYHALTLAAAVSPAQARSIRAGNLGGRGLEVDKLSLSLSMHTEELVAASAELVSPFGATADSEYSAAEQQKFKERFEKTKLGAIIAKGQKDVAAGASSVLSSTASASKSAKTGFCDKHLGEVLYGLEYFDNFFFDIYVPTREEITGTCSFGDGVKIFVDDDDDIYVFPGAYPNWGCPVVVDDEIGYFLDKEEDYISFFGPVFGYLNWKLVNYCECHQGYDLGCASKIPYPEYGPIVGGASTTSEGEQEVAGPVFYDSVVYPGDNTKKWEEYCKFAAIWNADVTDDDNTSRARFGGLTKEVQECGCFFIASAESRVGACPGVELFGYFDDDATTNDVSPP